MGGRHRSLTSAEVVTAITLLGFAYKETRGGHANYISTARGKFRKVTVSGHLAPFSQDLIGAMAFQAGVTKKELYAAVDGVIPPGWPA